jgi:hypothetical protein
MQCHEIFDFRIFHESVSFKPIKAVKFATDVVDTGGAPACMMVASLGW